MRLAARGAAPFHSPWADRILTPPAAGTIRLLDPPSTAKGLFTIEALWFKDMTLTEWITKLNGLIANATENPIAASFRHPQFLEIHQAIFYGNQRKRWLARVVLQRWTQRVWRKRTQCNVDMIDMQEIAEKDAIFLTDTKHRQIFRFHRRDIFTNLLTNITMSDEMLPSPRPPTNPWTNSRLTLAQTMSLCQQIVKDYAKRGTCPPVLFSAFWEARFNLRRFFDENSALLSQHAVRSFFKDLHEHNLDTVFDTMTNLLSAINADYSALSVRRWIRQTPQTEQHRAWLLMTRDYTLYINLHVQARPRWYSEEHIHEDVRRLWDRTTIPDIASQRMRLLRTAVGAPGLPQTPSLFGMMNLPIILQDPSGTTMTEAMAIELIQNALFRM